MIGAYIIQHPYHALWYVKVSGLLNSTEKTSIKTSFVEINKSKWSIALHHDPFNTRTLFSYQIFHKGNCKATPNWKLFGISNLTLSPFISFPHIGSYVYNECVDEQGSSSRLCDIPRNYYEEKLKDY